MTRSFIRFLFAAQIPQRSYFFAKRLCSSSLWFLLCTQIVQAQYFGKNKVGYRALNFKTLTAPHIQLYYYSSDSTASSFLIEAERWYKAHQSILKDSIKNKNPLILYNNHADFQQTTLFNMNIDPSTGGVTEGARNRVVMPFRHENRETMHVLGHEMVHAFQYNLMRASDTLALSSMQNIPLWIIEGMAEFLSLGRTDPHTAMWLRDAVIEEHFPSIEALNTPQYFPYRYGHAFWAFVTGLWGDEIIRSLFMNISMYGLEGGLQRTLGYDMQTLSDMWKEQTHKYYERFLHNKQKIVGEITYSDEQAFVLSPAISPDGHYLAFYTQLDPISPLDLVISDVSNKKIIRKINSLRQSSHIDFVSMFDSSPAWSPDSQRLAIVLFSKGKKVLTLLNAKNGKILDAIELPGVHALAYPAWSPDGKYIAISGMRDGQSDLYLLNLEDKSVKQLTHDKYSDIQPSWSEDGQKIVFATDRLSYKRKKHEGFFNIAIIDVQTKEMKNFSLFPGADNLEPQFTPDGGIIFLSDRDGFRNLYKHDLRISKTYAMTRLATGISGITFYSPAVSFSPAHSMVYYSLYQKGTYKIARAELKDFQYLPVEDRVIDKSAGCLPPKIPVKPERVSPNIEAFATLQSIPSDSIKDVPYQAHFKLEGIGSSGIGIGAGTGYGTYLSGGIGMKFSDVLSNNDLYTFFNVNGEIYDIGIMGLYVRKKHRIDWGVEVSHIPQLNIYRSVSEAPASEGAPGIRKVHTDILRTFVESISLLGYLPFSARQRLQANAGIVYQSYRIDRRTEVYLNNGLFYQFVAREQEKRPAPSPIMQYNAGLAWVGDNARMGLVGPIDGYRYHVGVTQFTGNISYRLFIADGRFYRWVRPIGLALRLYHIGRYGKGSEDSRMYPFNVAFPTLVHGYDYFSAYRDNNVPAIQNTSGQFAVNDYVGSKLLVGNVEIRIPFTGPKKAALVPSAGFFTEFALFADWGLAFSSEAYTRRLFGVEESYTQKPIYSTGLAWRINLFGFFVLEPFYAIPFQRVYPDGSKGKGTLGINLFPSW